MNLDQAAYMLGIQPSEVLWWMDHPTELKLDYPGQCRCFTMDDVWAIGWRIETMSMLFGKRVQPGESITDFLSDFMHAVQFRYRLKKFIKDHPVIREDCKKA